MASIGLAGIMLGFGVLYFVCYFIMDWIYETKEDRKISKHKHIVELKPVTKDEVMKRGVGQHEFVCSGIFFRKCRPKELYQDSVEIEYVAVDAKKDPKKKNAKGK